MKGECFVCGSYGETETHHIFGGGLRKKSDRLGLTVKLCHACHNEPPRGAHYCRETAEYLKRYGQKKAMREQGWSVERFIAEFGKNYLEEENQNAE